MHRPHHRRRPAGVQDGAGAAFGLQVLLQWADNKAVKAGAAVVGGDLHRDAELAEVFDAQQGFGGSGADESADTVAFIEQLLGNERKRRRADPAHDQEMLATRLAGCRQIEGDPQRAEHFQVIAGGLLLEQRSAATDDLDQQGEAAGGAGIVAHQAIDRHRSAQQRIDRPRHRDHHKVAGTALRRNFAALEAENELAWAYAGDGFDGQAPIVHGLH